MSRLLICLIIVSCQLAVCKEYLRVCYYTNWAQYRPGEGRFTPDDIDPLLCTHVIYAFAKIGRDHTLSKVEWNDDVMYRKVINLKQKNPKLKILLSVGGWNHENGATSKFSKMVSTIENRSTFVRSCVEMLRVWGFDGLDVNWEFPASRGNSPRGDKQRYTQLIRELSMAFKRDAANDGKSSSLLLSAGVSAGVKIINVAYEVRELGKLFDWINLMTYDFHGQWESITGHHSPIGSDGAGERVERKEMTISYGLESWLKNGFPANKIALGLATYGRTFRLKHPTVNGLGVPTASWQKPRKGTYTREAGFLSYYEICNSGFTIKRDNKVGAPYGYKGYEWVGFDDAESLKLKTRTYIKRKGLAGAMFWSLPLDDFSGNFCGQGRYPLISAVAKELATTTQPITVATQPITVTTQPITVETKPVPKTRQQLLSTQPQLKTVPIIRITSTPIGCRGFGLHKNNVNKHRWCRVNCERKFCPKSECRCEDHERVDCYSTDTWARGVRKERKNDWCESNCAMGYCPPNYCICNRSQ